MGQIVDIDNVAIKATMDIFGIQDQVRCLDMVRKTFHYFGVKQHAGE
jgi:hypothetical protein